MKELVQHFREQPKEAIKEVAMCVMIFAVCGAMLLLFTILQGCSAGYKSNGKATIITTDTTYIYHGGSVKFPKTK